jgi:Rha family phage regulatory protein
VAKLFEKDHHKVLRDIRDLIAKNPDWGLSNFALTSYKNRQGKTQPEYVITQEGFLVLTMSYTGEKAFKLKKSIARAFTEMSRVIQERDHARLAAPHMTGAIKTIANPAPDEWYIYSNYNDMINVAVLGMTAKQYKEKTGGQVVRENITAVDAALITECQLAVAQSVLMGDTFQETKIRINKLVIRLRNNPYLLDKKISG